MLPGSFPIFTLKRADATGHGAEDMAMDGTSAFGEQDSRPQPGSPMSGGGSVREPERLRDPENPRRGWLWSKVLWVLIIATCGGLHWMQTQPPPVQHTPDPTNLQSSVLRYMSRVSLGMNEVLGLDPAKVFGQPNQIVESLENSATGPIELVRASIVAAAVFEDQAAAQLLLNKAEVALNDRMAELEPVEDEAIREQRERWRTEVETDIESARSIISGMDAAALDDAARVRFETRHGYFGELARSVGQPETAPGRRAILGDASALLVRVMAMVSIAICAFVLGFVLFIVMLAKRISGSLKPRMNNQRTMSHRDRTLLLESFMVFLLGFFVVREVAGVIIQQGGPDLSKLLIWLLLLAPLWPLLRGMKWRELHIALGWHANGTGLKGVIKESGLGVVGYLAGLPIVLLGVLIMFAMLQLTSSQPTHPAVNEATNADLLTALKIYVLASLWAPMVEESVFRGSMYYNLRGWMHPLLAGVVVAFFFAIIHPQGIAVVPALMSLAIVFALMREWRGSIIGPMVAHGVHNAFVMTMVIFVFAM